MDGSPADSRYSTEACVCTSPRAAQRQSGVRLHALVQRGHRQELPLVNAEFGDIFVRFHVFCRPLLHGRPRVKVEHLRSKSRGGFDCLLISAILLVSALLYQATVQF